MRKPLIVILCISLMAAILSIYFLWDWVIANQDLTAGFLTSFLLFLAFIAALLNLRQMSHDRKTSLAMSLRETYDSGEILEARALVHAILNEQENEEEKQKHFLRVVKDYRKKHPREFVRLTSIPAMFDSIGWLVRESCCEPRVIDEQLDWESVYKLWELYIREVQGKKNCEALDESPTAMYGNFVWLVNRLTN